MRIALAGMFLVVAGAAFGAMPLSAHAQAAAGPVFITPVPVASGTYTPAVADSESGYIISPAVSSEVDWTTYSISSGVLPPTATGVILEAHMKQGRHEYGVGNPAVFIKIRKNKTSPEYVLSKGIEGDNNFAFGYGYLSQWTNQGAFPFDPTTGTFEFTVSGAELGGSWEIKIIGYTTNNVFISPVIINSGTTASVPWLTAFVAPYIPSDATGIILEAEGAMWSPDGEGDVDAHIKIRKVDDPLAPQYVLLRGRASSASDYAAWSSQGAFPITTIGTFQHSVEAPGFNGGWVIRLIGYTTINEFIATVPVDDSALSGIGNFPSWKIYDNAGLSIPSGATAVILEAEAAACCNNNDPSGRPTGHIRIKKNSTDPDSKSYVLIKGDAWGAGDSFAWANQGVFPITPGGTFQYKVDGAFDNGWSLRIVGYVIIWPPPPICPSFGLERTTTYDLQDPANAYGYGVAVDNLNNTYITGEQFTPAKGLDMYVIKYDANGALVWRDVYDVIASSDESGNESGHGIAVTPDGSAVYVVGSQRYNDLSTSTSDVFVRKYDAAGNVVWTQVYDSGSNRDSALAAAVDSAGNVYVAGHRGKTSGLGVEAILLSYTASGTLRAGFPPIVFSSAYNSSALGVTVSGSSVYITGYGQPSQNDSDMFVHQYTTSGAWVWSDTYQSSPEIVAEMGYGVSVDSGGNMFVMGYTGSSGGHLFLRKYNPAKTVVWSEVRNSAGVPNDIGRGMVVGNSGRIFIAGHQSTNTGDAFLAEYYTKQQQDTPTTLSALLNTYPYRGPQGGGLPVEDEMAFGIAQTNSTAPGHTTTSNDVYVVGYQASNGGEAFLNKYGCNASGGGPGGGGGATLIADFSATPVTGTDPLTVNVDARASAGTITSYEWDWSYIGTTFDNEGTGAITSHIYTIPGTYTIALRITAGGGATSLKTQAITVFPNLPPVASFKVCDVNNSNCVTSTPPPPVLPLFTGVAPLRVNVDGIDSSDPNVSQGGYIASFSWDWGDGTTPGVGEKATHQYFIPGTYTITLTVMDNGGLSNTAVTSAVKEVSVIAQYVCTSGSGPGGSCAGATSVCGPTETAGVTACYACLEDASCGIGYQCLGVSCKQGDMCLPDAVGNPVACPLDGKCPELVTCNPLATGATCPDGSTCPASGMCAPAKNVCALSGSGVDAQCYVEEQGSCVINADCTESLTGGVCNTATGACRYARCSNETGLVCTTDVDCADSDGICNAGACVYIYDCAYGPGMGTGVTGMYVTSTPDTMPKIPMGVQPDGQACTQPTSDAPNNCEGINGCLYYNYKTTRGFSCATSACQSGWTCQSDKFCYQGQPIANSSNSVANCVNTFEGGTGCMYYQYYDGTTQTEKANCLPRYAENSKKSPQAGIPEGCFVVDKGKAGKEYNCTSIDGCYYYLDGSVDCTYTKVTETSCTTNAECGTASTSPLMIPVCDIGGTNRCEYQGNGCKYEPNPKGAISCPGAVNPATGGDDFVQCMLNPDGLLPGFLTTSANALTSCNTNADCPPNNICLNGTCFPVCQGDVDCATGEQCLTSCTTSMDCTAGLICDGLACVPPQCAGATPSGTLWNVTAANLGLVTATDSQCRYSIDSATAYTAMTPFATTNTTSHSQQLTGLVDGSYAYYVLCQELSSSVLANLCQIDFTIDTLMCIPGTICPNGAVCPASGVCPATVPACAGGFPVGTLPFGTTTTDIGLTTAQDASCRYSLVAIDPYAMMAPFTTTGTISHSTNVTGLFTGLNTYYAKCQDVTDPTKITNACSIVFKVGDDCTSNLQCFGGFQCVNGTCQPPVCENALPTGALPPGTSSTTISMTTPADATCRYSIDSADLYGAMTPFTATGATNHSSFVSGLVNGSNTHYVRCQDAVTSAEKFCSIPFSVGVCNQEYKCATGWMCIPNIGNGICTPPPPPCDPGTLCPDGQTCPVNGQCPWPPPCVGDPILCPLVCQPPSTYNAVTGACEYSIIYDTFCSLNPTHPLCVGGGGPGGGSIVAGITSCNTLGYTFTGTAITPSGNCDLVAIILALLSWMAWIIALLAVLSGLRAAYLYITSMGDERKLILARRYLIYTTIGVGVSVLTFSIVAITRAILNI